jgi:hypothetical protein
MIIADVAEVIIEDSYLDANGRFDLNNAELITYSHGEYYMLGEKLGTFGYSVKNH